MDVDTLQVRYLKKKDLERIDRLVRERVTVDKALDFFIKKNIEKYKSIKSYIGRRHSSGSIFKKERFRAY